MMELLAQYGYAAILVGTFLEGETILIAAGLAAHAGYLVLPWVILAAFLGTLAGDQLFFHLGRRHSGCVLSLRPSWRPGIEKADRLLKDHQTLLVAGFRFLYGLRTISPFVIGMSSISPGRFVLLNSAGALAWAAVIASLGYLAGGAIGSLLGNIRHIEKLALLAILAAGALIWCIHFLRNRQRMREGSVH